MKLIQAMKQVKELTNKANDLVSKVSAHCAILDIESPVYPDQKAQVDTWIQSHHDVVKEIERLRLAIQRTNLDTRVEIKLGERNVTKSIAAWILRRRDLANLEATMWSKVGDRGLKEGAIASSSAPGTVSREVKILRYYDPKLRDEKLALYKSEPALIDSTLEVANAVTDLIEEGV